jgi:hypothetical protein
MYYAYTHHRAVVNRIVSLHEMDFDVVRGVDPVTARARDNAMHFIARRPDLAIGMSVAGTPEGGLQLDFVRGGREFIISIDDRGGASLVSSSNIAGMSPVTIATKGINQIFMAEIDAHAPDPVSRMIARRNLTPPPGELHYLDKKASNVVSIQTDESEWIGVKNENARYGFDMTCFRLDEHRDPKDIDAVLNSTITTGCTVAIARRFEGGPIVSLHDISILPANVIDKGKLPDGQTLLSVQKAVLEAREDRKALAS